MISSYINDSVHWTLTYTYPTVLKILAWTDSAAVVLTTDDSFEGTKSILPFCQGCVMEVHNSASLPSSFKEVTSGAIDKLSQQLEQTIETQQLCQLWLWKYAQ